MSRASHRHTCPKQPSPRMLNTLRWCRGNSHRSSDLVFPDPGVGCWNISVVQSAERKAPNKDSSFSCMKLQCAIICHHVCKTCQMHLVCINAVPYLSQMTTTFTHKQDDSTYKTTLLLSLQFSGKCVCRMCSTVCIIIRQSVPNFDDVQG